MFGNILRLLALFATVTGVSLPQVLQQDYVLVPTYTDTNVATVAVLPQPVMVTQPLQIDTDSGPAVSARAVLVMDQASGAILWQKNPDEQEPVASLTKLMTALVASDYITNWDDTYSIQWSDLAVGNSAFSAGVGDTFTKHDLLKAALIGSVNQAAMAVAHSTGLSDTDFVAAMNAKAQLLGMAHSAYVEPTGLEAGNQSSARDLALLLRTIIEQPILLEAISQTEHRMMNGDQEMLVHTTDDLLKAGDDYVVAGKTGFTNEAGNCFVSMNRNAHGQTIVIVVLGAPDDTSRFTITHDLAEWTFHHYRWP